MTINYKNNNDSIEENNISEVTPTPVGDCLWKLPGDDDIDASDVFDCPMIPGTSGVEC